MLLTLFPFLLLGSLPANGSSIEDYITRCAEERKTLILDDDITISKDVVFYKIKGQGHTINIVDGVTIRTKNDSLLVSDVTFVINEYGNKYGFSSRRGQLIQSNARDVYFNNIIVKTGKEGDSLKYDETSGWRGRSFLLINNANRIVISHITSYNVGSLITYANSHNAIVDDVIAYNCETNQYIKPSCSQFCLSNIEIRNTEKDKYWVVGGMNGVGTNGKCVVLTGAWDCSFNNIKGENCIERVIYSNGGGNIKATNLCAINSDGFKFVGQKAEEADWVSNIVIKKCKWIKTASEIDRVNILKSNLSKESPLTLAPSNLGVFQIYNVNDIIYDDVYIEDRTGENSASIGSVYNCHKILLINWIIRNVRCARPVVYITGNMPDKATIEMNNMSLFNYAPSNRIGESILVGYRSSESNVSALCKNIFIQNDEGNISNELLGRGINCLFMKNIRVKGGLSKFALSKLKNIVR